MGTKKKKKRTRRDRDKKTPKDGFPKEKPPKAPNVKGGGRGGRSKDLPLSEVQGEGLSERKEIGRVLKTCLLRGSKRGKGHKNTKTTEKMGPRTATYGKEKGSLSKEYGEEGGESQHEDWKNKIPK